VDLRESAGPEALAKLLQLWGRRQSDAATLAQHLPGVKEAASRQLDEIVDCANGGVAEEQALPC
jgi:hypothetical protein